VTLRRLVLWRHGETDYNAGRRMQGQLDSTLTPVGIEQARRAARVIAGFGPQVLLTSDLRRASDTAAVLAEHTGLVPGIDKRLRETHLGHWQGLTHAEVDAAWPGARLTWRLNPEWAPLGGETRVEVATRARAVVDELDEKDVETAVLCAHGGLIGSLSASLLNLPVANWSSFGAIGNCRWTVLGRLRRAAELPWRLLTYNAGLLE
jgi:glucosyl-3-phosphoglycerate phosphatase